MKTIHFNWKYILMGILCTILFACTNDSDEPNPVEKNEISRSTDLYGISVDLTTTPGTLQEKVEEALALDGKDITSLQKLTIVGQYNGWDVEYWKTLPNLIEFDLKDAVPTDTDENTFIDEWNYECRQENNQIMVGSFYKMSSLEKIEFPSCITSIQRFACKGCINLKEVVFPLSLDYIGYDAFNSCGFTSLELPSSVTLYDGYSFGSCPNLKSVKFPEGMIIIPNGIFDNCSNLEKVELSSTITEVNSSAFRGCKSLKDYTLFLQIQKMQYDSFANTGFESIDLSNVIEFGGEACFENCTNLKSVILPSQLKELPNYIFWDCDSLKSITLPSTLEKIGYASLGDTGLESIEIPSSVRTIEDQAFRNTKLTSLVIPETVTNVTSKIVDWCQYLKYIIWKTSANFEDVDNFNYNCYLFINKNVSTGPNWHDKNVFRKEDDGKYYIDTFILDINVERRNQNLSIYIPEDFTAKNVIYERIIDQWTYPGISSGWQTIVLPFSPTTIRHKEKGEIAPFNKEIEGNRHFWLRELTTEGWTDRTEMVANVPYIIAMPNHDSYMDEYRLNGNIEFIGQNVDFKKNTDEDSNSALPASEGPDYNFQPTFNYVEKDESVYALNVDCWINGYEWGGVFAKYSQDVFAFEAYVTTNGRLARTTFGIDTSSSNTRSAKVKNMTGIPQIGDM